MKIVKLWLKIVAYSLLLASLVVGCSAPPDRDLNEYIEQIKTRPARPIEPIPAFPPIVAFSYPENDPRRSPFRPKIVVPVADILAPNPNRVKQPLEAFPLDSLKFVGILKQGAIIWALIQQPGGTITRVRKGDYMGQNYGKILFITDNSIKIEETMQIEGKWHKKITLFNLTADQ